MSTKKPKPDPELDTGEPDVGDFYPRIVWTPYVMDGQPHLRGTEVALPRILRVLADQMRFPDPAILTALFGYSVRDTDIRTTLLFSADMLEHLTALDAELARRMAQVGRRRKKHRKRKEASHEHDEAPSAQAPNGTPSSDHHSGPDRH